MTDGDTWRPFYVLNYTFFSPYRAASVINSEATDRFRQIRERRLARNMSRRQYLLDRIFNRRHNRESPHRPIDDWAINRRLALQQGSARDPYGMYSGLQKKLAILAFSLIKEALAEHESTATPLNAWHQTKEDQSFLKRYYKILYYKGLQSPKEKSENLKCCGWNRCNRTC